jgi:uncharacterized protein (DUF983 family)
MGSINGLCDTCGQKINYPDLVAHDDVCESCFMEYGVFEDEVSE